MSDKSEDILRSLGKLKPNEMREIIENLARQSGMSEPELATKMPKLAHLPARLTADEIVERASLRAETKYYQIIDGSFETIVSSQDAKDLGEAYKVAYGILQPWYFTLRSYWPEGTGQTQRQHKMLSHDEYCDWLRRE